MGDIPETSEYWAVECDECDKWIAIRPAGRINNVLIEPTEPFPDKFTVAGHEHGGIFLSTDVRPRILSHQPTNTLPKFTRATQHTELRHPFFWGSLTRGATIVVDGAL
jgi:hypothetical protein